MKEQTRQPNQSWIWPLTNSGFHILIWNPQSIKQNGNNAGIIIPTIDSSKSSLLKENGDQLWENQEENKSLYPDCALVIQGLLTISYWNRNNNHHVWPCTVKHVLIEFKAFALIRKQFFKMNLLRDLFDKAKMNDVLSFRSETELYQKIWWIETG